MISPARPDRHRLCFRNVLFSSTIAMLVFASGVQAQQTPPWLAKMLTAPAEKVAALAVANGDPKRGAMIFFQPSLGCTKCHATSDSGPLSTANVGPNLTRFDPSLTDAGIVEAVLTPSKSIAKGFETTRVLTTSGQIMVGLLQSENDEIVRLRDPSTGTVMEIAKDDIETLDHPQLSIMPAELATQLTDRQQLLDLIRYLIELKMGGLARAKELQPAVLPTAEPLPEYEAHIDHTGFISSFNKKSLKRGEAIYERTCMNCHGTVTEAGSLPTSLRFASGKFKNGNDPFKMYQTITHGFGLMTPQRWMVPQQKYDVIHYIRETYLKPHNPSQYAKLDDAYLASLPKGDTRGPEPSRVVPWSQMDYGPNLMATIEVGNSGDNIAYKGHTIRLDHGPGGVAQGKSQILYELDTMRVAAVWQGDGFIDWNGINFNGQHQVHPRVVGTVLHSNKAGAGWANPETGDFAEVRAPSRDGKFHGPLPKSWINYLGTYASGLDSILRYRVGETEIHEMPSLRQLDERSVVQRQLEIGPAAVPLTLRIADRDACEIGSLGELNHPFAFSPSTDAKSGSGSIAFTLAGDVAGTQWSFVEDEIRLSIPASDSKRTIAILSVVANDLTDAERFLVRVIKTHAASDLQSQLKGGDSRWPETVSTSITSKDSGAFAIDTITYPLTNPWSCRMRLTGFDFYEDGDSAAVADWDGNVWKVTGLSGSIATWKRIASGLFQPLGLKIRDGEVFVNCRDQICRLHDYNGDGESDYYESFNHDHQVTEHFHEFAMGLQTDADGNFYYAKSARHALPAVVPHHGTLLRVSADGSETTILANGFRAANGVCLNDDGSFFVTDQEGHWNPKNRINWVKPGRFYGNMFGYHDRTDSSDSGMEPPMCWITNAFDRSPAELLWVKSDKWGPLNGSLLNLSYGYGKVYIVPHEQKGELLQGGMCELPIPQFPTGIMRGRFHPTDGGLYLAGMFSWAGTQEENGGFYRMRYTGKPAHLPRSLECQGTTIRIGFTDDIDQESVVPENFSLSRWSIKRTKNYGSDHYDTTAMKVANAHWSAEDREVILEVPDLIPTWCMEIKCDLRSPEGEPVHRIIHHTIHILD